MEQATEYELSVIVACSRPKKVQLLLDGFSKQKGTHSFEVILIGDIPGDLAAYSFPISAIGTENIHVNEKRNKGLQQSRGLSIALLDDDTVPFENWVEQAVLSVNKHPKSLIAGREVPFQNSDGAKLTFSVSQILITEGYKGHVNGKTESVSWWDVPFCNCVGNKQIFHGGFDTSIPWDMDDFHFCFARKDEIAFQNNPDFVVQHDRYQSSLSSFLNYKWNLRVRTGEKIISHSRIYLKIPSLIILLLAPLALGAILVSGLLPIFTIAYLIIVAASVINSGRAQFLQKTWLIFRIHVVTFLGYWFGILKGIGSLIR